MASYIDQERRQKLQRILQPMQAREQFTADEIKEICSDLAPAFITRIIKQLVDDHVVEVHDSAGLFRWRNEPEKFLADDWIDQQIRGVQITQSPEQERPRERLLKIGAAQLRTAELIAILVRSGRQGESALQVGERIANRFGNQLASLPGQGLAELKHLSSAVSEPAYCQIMAGIELGRRVAVANQDAAQGKVRIIGSPEAIDYCRQEFARLIQDRQQEEFHIVTLDTKHQPIATHQISVGTLDASLVHPREVFRPAIRDAAAAILIVHNHPSGDPTPSREDRKVMQVLADAGELIGIKLLDSIIVAATRCISMREGHPNL